MIKHCKLVIITMYCTRDLMERTTEWHSYVHGLFSSLLQIDAYLNKVLW